MMLMLALGTALILVTTTETRIAENHRDGVDAFYAADAAIDIAMSSLRTVPYWNDVLTGAATSTFIDGPPLGIRRQGGGALIDLTRESPKDATKVPWRLYVYGPLGDLLHARAVGLPIYVAVWVAGDPDIEDTLMLWASAFGPGGARRNVEATVRRRAAGDPATGELGIQTLSWRER